MQKLTFFVLFCFHTILFGQDYFPKNDGVKQSFKNYTVFTNALIHVNATTKIEDGTLVIKEGKIVSIGKSLTIPKNANVIDLKGKTIYPSFIDLFTEFGIQKPQNRSERSNTPQYDSNREGYYWNDHVKPEYNSYENLDYSSKDAKEWRNIGFGTVLSHHNDGVISGTGLLWTLNDNSTNAFRILNNKISQHFSFSRSKFSRQSYPSSLMGSMALIRQVYHDAKWYSQGSSKSKDLSLESFNANRNLIQIFDAGDKLTTLRADKIGDEFGVKYLLKGSGNEFERIDEILKTKASFIIPINFPEAYDVSDPYLAQQVSLSDMRFWNQAPYNLKILNDNNISFTLTTSELKDKGDFLKNLRKAVKCGLPKEKALASLTEIPAKMMNMSDKIGVLKENAWANFIITSGDIFEDKTIIHENWIQGEKYEVKKMVTSDIRGNYDLTFNNETYKLKISGEIEKPEAKIEKDSIEYGTKLEFSEPWINLVIKNKDTLSSQFYRLSGLKTNNTIEGKIVFENGNEGKWIATLTKEFEAKEKESKEKDKSKEKMFPITFPNVGFGSLEKPKQETLLFKNATVWTNEKEGILKNADVLIENGKISKIGTNLTSTNAKIIDATGKHLTAGIIDEHSHIAISRGVNESGQNCTAEVTIEDVVNSEDVNIYRNLSGGVTAANLLHGSANPIGGRAAFIKLKWGYAPDELLVTNAPKYIKFALGENVKQSNWGESSRNRFPQSRMGVEQVYEDYFSRAREYQKEWQNFNSSKSKNKKTPRFDIEMEVLGQILDKKRFITCHSYVQSEINMLMKLAERYGFKVQTFTHILEGYKLADKMAEHGVAGSTFADWWAYKFEVNDAIPYNAALMKEQGVLVSINSDDAEMSRRLNQEAAKAVKYGGVSEEEAWKMVTLNPAKILQVDDKVGSIKMGKDADVVLWTDNPLSIYAKVEKTVIEGIVFYDLEQQEKLQEEIKKESAEIINLMLEAKSKGMKTQAPKKKAVGHYHCDTHGEFCKISHYKHF